MRRRYWRCWIWGVWRRIGRWRSLWRSIGGVWISDECSDTLVFWCFGVSVFRCLFLNYGLSNGGNYRLYPNPPIYICRSDNFISVDFAVLFIYNLNNEEQNNHRSPLNPYPIPLSLRLFIQLVQRPQIQMLALVKINKHSSGLPQPAIPRSRTDVRYWPQLTSFIAHNPEKKQSCPR